MCGRFAQSYGWQEYRDRLAIISSASNRPANWNIAPTTQIDVALPADGGRENARMRWGLVPPWAKQPGSDYPTFNARAETAPEKASFRQSFRTRRCLIPASGFYEWRKADRQPFWIGPAEGPFFVFAGLWSLWREELLSCTIVTTAATGQMAEIHHRSPVILPPEHWAAWEDKQAGLSDLQALLQAPAPDQLAMHPVDRRVGKVGENDAGLAAPIPPAPPPALEPGQGSLF